MQVPPEFDRHEFLATRVRMEKERVCGTTMIDEYEEVEQIKQVRKI